MGDELEIAKQVSTHELHTAMTVLKWGVGIVGSLIVALIVGLVGASRKANEKKFETLFRMANKQNDKYGELQEVIRTQAQTHATMFAQKSEELTKALMTMEREVSEKIHAFELSQARQRLDHD